MFPWVLGKERAFCYCWIEWSINVNIFLVFDVFEFYILEDFLAVLSIIERGVQEP